MVRAWHGRGMGMASVNQTRPHCINQMGKTRSKPLAARHGRRTAWARHGHGMGTARYVPIGLQRAAGCSSLSQASEKKSVRDRWVRSNGGKITDRETVSNGR